MRRTPKIMSGLLFVSFLFLVPLSVATANPPRSWNHRDNPALLGVRQRTFFEFAGTQSFGISNNYLSPGRILQSTITIDLDDLDDQLGERNFTIASTTHTGSHLAISLFDVSAAIYSSLDSIVSLGVPGSLFTLVAKGNEMDAGYVDSAPVIGRVFAEAGAQSSYRYRDWEVGVKLGLFTPLLYTSPDAEVSYRFATDEEAGTLELAGGLNVPAYSSIDLENPGSGSSEVSLDGVKLDFGVIRVRSDGTPWFGVNMGGITLSPATASYEVVIDNQVSVTVDNALDGNTDEAINTETSDSELTVVADADNQVRMPFKFGGFYRSTIIPWLALTGHSQVYFADPTLFSAGVMVEGTSFPLNALALSLGYDRVAWETEIGLRTNVRVIDLGFEVGLSSPRFVTMFQGTGLNANLFLAVGY